MPHVPILAIATIAFAFATTPASAPLPAAPRSLPPEDASGRTAGHVADGLERGTPGFLDYHAAATHAPALDAARQINARIPFAAGSILPAAPFFVSGATDDRLRARDCLAAAAYYEAGNDVQGQRAVMQVVLNRVRHPSFASTICGVVFEGADRRTGCQFTFTCDGALDRYRPSARAWRQAQQIATEALYGYAAPAVGYATHYHTDWVHPPWSDQLEKIAAVGSHLFFQSKDVRARDFSSRYAGAEPRTARLALLSPVHEGQPARAPSDMARSNPAYGASAPEADAGMAPRETDEHLPQTATAPGPDVFLVVLDAAADPGSYLQLARTRCADRLRCRFIGWTDATKRASQIPMPGSAVDAISFSYSRTSNGASEVRWNCREFPRPSALECLRWGE